MLHDHWVPQRTTTINATLNHTCNARTTTSYMHSCDTPTGTMSTSEVIDIWLLEVWKWWLKQYSMALFWCQHVKTCNSTLIGLFSITTLSGTRSSNQGAGHMQWFNLDYICLVDAPLITTLEWNTFKKTYWWIICIHNIQHSVNMNKLMHSFTKELNWQTIHENR